MIPCLFFLSFLILNLIKNNKIKKCLAEKQGEKSPKAILGLTDLLVIVSYHLKLSCLIRFSSFWSETHFDFGCFGDFKIKPTRCKTGENFL